MAVAGQMNGQTVNLQNIARESAVARSTAETYFAILEDTLLGHFLPAGRPRLKVREAARKHRPIAYYRTPAGVEVDFVIENSGDTYPNSGEL